MKLKKGLIVFVALILLSRFVYAAETVTGTVAETIDVGTYVYVRLEQDDTWLASSPLAVKVGDHVEFVGGALMKDFYSPKLDRTFADIVFVSRLRVVESAAEPAGAADHHAGVSGNDPHAPASPVAVPPPKAGEIVPIEGGMTIEKILTGDESLASQRVVLRARVMKVSTAILGKNWVTLQDGTGSAPDNQLIATSEDLVEAGTTVTVSGVVRHNVDIGSGYSYKVVLEGASFDK